MHRCRPLAAVLALGLLAVLGAGCDVFKVARPEAGDTGAVLLPSYVEPESCLRYMQLGIERKDNVGQAAYLGALADSTKDGVGFHAFFDPAVWNAYTGTDKPADWDLSHETQFLAVLVRVTGDPYLMLWQPDEVHPHDEEVDATHRILHRHYLVYSMQQSTGVSLLIAVGYADLYFTKTSAARWALARWQDRVDPEVGAQPADPLQQTFGYRRLNAGAGG
jgi:hypothetical protein